MRQDPESGKSPWLWAGRAVPVYGVSISNPEPGKKSSKPETLGFSLLEIMVVLVLISIATAVVMPRLVPQISSSRLRAGAVEIASIVNTARFRAVQAGKTLHLFVHRDERMLALSIDDAEKPVIRRHLPEGLSISWIEKEGRPVSADPVKLAFLPDGTNTEARLKLSGPAGASQVLRLEGTGGRLDVE